MQAIRNAISTQIAKGGDFAVRQTLKTLNGNPKFMYNLTVTFVIVTVCVLFGYTFALRDAALSFKSPVPGKVDSVMFTLGAVIALTGMFEYVFKRDFGIIPLKIVGMVLSFVVIVCKYVCVPLAPQFAIIAIAGFLVHKHIINHEPMLDYHMDVVSHIADSIILAIRYCQRTLDEFFNPSRAGYFINVEKVSDN